MLNMCSVHLGHVVHCLVHQAISMTSLDWLPTAAGVRLEEEDPGSPGAFALLTFSNVSIIIQDSLLQQLSTPQDAVLAFHSSSVSLVRTSFVNNVANVSGGLMAHNTSHLSMEDCHFINNTGMPG